MITLPQFIMIPRKTKVDRKINLNHNTMHHVDRFTYNIAKIEFKNIVKKDIYTLPRLTLPIRIIYTYYSGTKRLGDLSNHCVFVDKFFSDALVELGYLPDDNYNYIREVIYRYGGYDKNNQRIEAIIQGLGTEENNLGFTWTKGIHDTGTIY